MSGIVTDSGGVHPCGDRALNSPLRFVFFWAEVATGCRPRPCAETTSPRMSSWFWARAQRKCRGVRGLFKGQSYMGTGSRKNAIAIGYFEKA